MAIKGEAELAELARSELPAVIASCWIGLLRPGFLMREAKDHERVVAQLGGIPVLADGMAWPQHPDGRGPLTFIAQIDCGELPASTLALPPSGRLSFFAWDEQATGYLDADQVVYTPAQTPVSQRQPPAGCREYDPVKLTGEVCATGPDWSNVVFREALAELGEEGRAFLGDPEGPESFRQGLWDLRQPQPWHRIGGYAEPLQDQVEWEMARLQLPPDLPAGITPALHREALRWRLLVQIDSTGPGMEWGGGAQGCLYWLIRADDLAARKFEAASLTWQV